MEGQRTRHFVVSQRELLAKGDNDYMSGLTDRNKGVRGLKMPLRHTHTRNITYIIHIL